MDPLDFFIMEEFIFPEEGGVTGTVEVACPHCDSVWVLAPRCQWISCQSVCRARSLFVDFWN